jgi:hypothetical protein
MTPLWYWSKADSESELSTCSMMGAGGGRGGKLYRAASVAILGETWETLLVVESEDQDNDEWDSTDDEPPLLESLSVSLPAAPILVYELCGTGGVDSDSRCGS